MDDIAKSPKWRTDIQCWVGLFLFAFVFLGVLGFFPEYSLLDRFATHSFAVLCFALALFFASLGMHLVHAERLEAIEQRLKALEKQDAPSKGGN